MLRRIGGRPGSEAAAGNGIVTAGVRRRCAALLARDPHAQAALLDLDFGEPGFVEQRGERAHDLAR